MFNVGGGEVLVIAVIALIVLGPQRLPDAAKQVGRFMGEVRRLSTGFQSELKGAFEEAERSADAPPPRDVLAKPPTEDPTPAATPGAAALDAGEGTNGQRRATRPRRRVPLRAAPAEESPPTADR